MKCNVMVNLMSKYSVKGIVEFADAWVVEVIGKQKNALILKASSQHGQLGFKKGQKVIVTIETYETITRNIEKED